MSLFFLDFTVSLFSQEVIVVVVVEVGEGVLVLAGLERGKYEEQSRRGRKASDTHKK